ncbi:ankyrin repeat-containing domain protein [Mycena albidolilacea]|uniref:Ankyrin repeat-containing domain protein n=1 Tax=Mycena albidolilacea TaxID=1033008 RepID=A0AAD7A7L0_9AGAR|nr:ankyrin repeat-containing domain protein [Mycena albidolilacea]
MTMPDQHNLTIYGSAGGGGGLGVGQGTGGSGGAAHGPYVNVGPGTMHIHNHGEAENRDIILNWLSPINLFLRHANISQTREKGTGGWLLEDPVFKKWESGSGSTLWCYGICISLVVDYLSAAYKNNKDIGVACIYLNHKEANQQPPPKLLAEGLYKQHREKGTTLSLEEVVNVLSSSLKEFAQVFIIVDAMDEYPESQQKILLQQLAGICSNVNLMITSWPSVSPELFSLANLEKLDIQATADDLREYIDAQIHSSRLSQIVKDLPELQEEIRAKIIAAADGMFLLAKFHVEALKTKNRIKSVRKALTELPKNLYDGYDVAMQRIEDQNEEDREIAHSTLIWVANAKRPLSVEELRVALAVEPETQQIDKENLLKMEIILGVCAGLVIVDKESSVVRLVHYTTQEYLDSIQAQQFPNAQAQITYTLLTFLNFDGFPELSWTWARDLPPLVEGTIGTAFRQWGNGEIIVASYYGHTEVVCILLDKGADVNAAGGEYGSSLQAAAQGGHTEVVCILLDKGADVNIAGGRYGSSLQAAAQGGHTEVVRILFDKGADINAAGGFYGSSLLAAACWGYTEVVCILLDKGADVNAAGGRYGSSLQAAAQGGYTEVVLILLDKGADVNAAGGEYGSSLQAAAQGGHTEVVRILLDKGADVNAAGGEYENSLQAAASWGCTEVVHMLMEGGARGSAPVETEGYQQ